MKADDKMNLLDLPTEILQKILTYLPDEHIYFNIRKVCHRLWDIADDYVQLGKYVLMNNESNLFRILIVFKMSNMQRLP